VHVCCVDVHAGYPAVHRHDDHGRPRDGSRQVQVRSTGLPLLWSHVQLVSWRPAAAAAAARSGSMLATALHTLAQHSFRWAAQ
jgi:hypothetical protein